MRGDNSYRRMADKASLNDCIYDSDIHKYLYLHTLIMLNINMGTAAIKLALGVQLAARRHKRDSIDRQKDV